MRAVLWEVGRMALVALVMFWAGFRFGGAFFERELDKARDLTEGLLKERNALKTNLDLAVKKARVYLNAEVHKKIFPWL